MHWFKHHTDMIGDAGMASLMMKYGTEGSGLYWFCLELIAKNIDAKRVSFELRHSPEVIAHLTCSNVERVEEILAYIVEVELFAHDDETGKIACPLLAQILENSIVKSPTLKAIQEKMRNGDDAATAANNAKPLGDTKRFAEFWTVYPDEMKKNKKRAEEYWKKQSLDSMADTIIADVKKRKTSDDQWLKNDGDYIPHPSNYLKDNRWEDEFTPVKRRAGELPQLAEDRLF